MGVRGERGESAQSSRGRELELHADARVGLAGRRPDDVRRVLDLPAHVRDFIHLDLALGARGGGAGLVASVSKAGQIIAETEAGDVAY